MCHNEYIFFKYLMMITSVVLIAVVFIGSHPPPSNQIIAKGKVIELAIPEKKTVSGTTRPPIAPREQSVQRQLIEQYNVHPEKARKLAPIYIQAEQRSSISTDILLAVSWTETRFRGHLVSHKGAVGMMQVMPNWWVDEIDFLDSRQDLFDVKKNIYAGAEILSRCAQRFGINQAARCYHGGSGGIYRPQASTNRYSELVNDQLRYSNQGSI